MKSDRALLTGGERRILTPKQAGTICGVHPATIVRWIELGKLKAYRTPGGHRRIFLKDLEDLMRPYGLIPEGEAPPRSTRTVRPAKKR